jgi:Skp family chaperone for outer membrane proteins
MFNWKTRFAVLSLTLTLATIATPAKAFSSIGIAIGGAMIGSAMQAERQHSQQSEQYQRREQYQRSENGAESKHTKKTTKAKNHKRERDDSKIAKDSPSKAKSPEPVASAPQTTPLTAGPPPTPDKFGD